MPAERTAMRQALKRPVGRPRQEVRRCYASFTYQAWSWKKPRRVVAKVEWHPGELGPGEARLEWLSLTDALTIPR
jgi:hypothetical protein